MKLIAIALFSLSLATAAFAEPPAAKPAPTKPADSTATDTVSDADAAKFLAFLDKIADAVVASNQDCAKMAAGINGVIDANLDMLKMAKAAHDQGRKLSSSAQEHIQGTMKRMMGGMGKCMQDKGVGAAFQRIDMKHG